MRLTATTFSLLLLPALLSSCSDVVPDSGLVGTYVADYRGDTAILSLKPDHTYTHTVLANGNKAEEQTSTWRTTDTRSRGYEWTVVDFTKFVATPAYRANERQYSDRERVYSGWVSPAEHTWLGKIELCFDSDIGYCYIRQANP